MYMLEASTMRRNIIGFIILALGILSVPFSSDAQQPGKVYGLISYRLLNGLSNGTRRTLLKPASAQSSRALGS